MNPFSIKWDPALYLEEEEVGWSARMKRKCHQSRQKLSYYYNYKKMANKTRDNERKEFLGEAQLSHQRDAPSGVKAGRANEITNNKQTHNKSHGVFISGVSR